MANSVISKNSTLSNLEENLFSMADENISLLSETTMPQRTAEHQINDENISEVAASDGAKTTTEYITLKDHGRISPSVKRKRGEDKAAIPERRLKQVSNKPGKVGNKTTLKEGAKNGSNMSQAHRASTSSAAQTVNMTHGLYKMGFDRHIGIHLSIHSLLTYNLTCKGLLSLHNISPI